MIAVNLIKCTGVVLVYNIRINTLRLYNNKIKIMKEPFIKNIKTLRKLMLLSQSDMCDKLGLTRQTVGRWERGKAKPTLDRYLGLCKKFGLDSDRFYSDEKYFENNNEIIRRVKSWM